MLDTDTGELIERRLEHANGAARTFYASLQGQVRVGIEATGQGGWSSLVRMSGSQESPLGC